MMVLRCKHVPLPSESYDDSKIPLKYKGHVIGFAIISGQEIMLHADKYENELKRAISEPNLSGFSIEMARTKK